MKNPVPISFFTLFVVCGCNLLTPEVISSNSQETNLVESTSGALFVDVRELSEIKNGIIKGANWLPTSAIKTNSKRKTSFMQKLENHKDKRILVYCASGYRSSDFTDFLKTKGFNAFNLGGYSDAIQKGLKSHTPSPISRDDDCKSLCF